MTISSSIELMPTGLNSPVRIINLLMNPENVGEHIMLRHSSLWRQPLTYQKQPPHAPPIRKQMNEAASMGVSWRNRNNFVKTHSGFRNHSTTNMNHKRTTSQQLHGLLKEEQKQSNMGRSMVKSLRQDAASIDRSKQLLLGMTELKKLGLLSDRDLQKVKFPGVIRNEHVHNDYHDRLTNPNFSRNHLGRFYTK